jgi:ribosomal protein L11 methylase PrmA
MTDKAALAENTILARLRLDEPTARNLHSLLGETLDPDRAATALVEQSNGAWAVELYFSEQPDVALLRDLIAQVAGAAAARTLTFSAIAARDWVRASLAGLKPVTAGRFVVHGRHDRASILPNRIAIEIEAALAFGTGHHATTRGCLLALDALAKRSKRRRLQSTGTGRPLVRDARPLALARVRASASDWARHHEAEQAGRGPGPLILRSPLPWFAPLPGRSKGAGVSKDGGQCRFHIFDLGTGSGVLAIAAAKALRQPVLASDIDRTAVAAAKDNARANRVGPLIAVVHAAGLSAAPIRARAPYRLVFANILLAPLKQLARPVAQVLAPGGHVILSGLLAAQANAALSAYRLQGLVLARRITLDNWVTLAMRKPARLSG